MMTNTTALQVEHSKVIRNVLLTALLAVAVAVTPKQAHAEHAETAAAVLIGAAVLYAAHDSYKSDKKYAKHHGHAHVHDRHCGHHVEYRGNQYHRYGSSQVHYQKYYSSDRYSHYGKHHKYQEPRHNVKHGKYNAEKQEKKQKYTRDDRKHKTQGKDDRHREQTWNTRVNVSTRH
jgi:hypothetical protein